MKLLNRSKSTARRLATICIAAGMYCGLTVALWSTEPKSDSADKAPAPNSEAKPEKQEPKKLTGAELYAINCNRCHAERYPTEFTSAQWKTLMTHMRVRANLPASQARLILKYLQEDSGN